MPTQEVTISTDQQVYDDKRKKGLKFLYPFSQFTASFGMSLGGSYLIFFLTNVYFLSVNFTAAISVISLIISWVFLPLFAAFLDRFQFKKSKFWPWIAIGGIIYGVAFILVMSLPALGVKNAAALAPLVFALVIVTKLSESVTNVPLAGIFPRMSKDPKDRQYFAMSQKVGRDGGKTIWGYIIPTMLLAMTAFSGSEFGGYMYTAMIAYGVFILGQIIFGIFGLRGSYVEREALADTQKAKAANVPLSVIFKTIFTNRPALGIFLFMLLHKTYYFIYLLYATYIFKYVYGGFAKLGLFFSIFSLCSVIGVMAGTIWARIFKESKKSFISAMTMHVLLTAVIAFLFRSITVDIFLVLFGISCFFMGMLENWIMPMFAASADYGAWKTGVRMDNLIMSIYQLAVFAAYALPPIIAPFVLNPVHYTQFVASGAAVTEPILAALSFLFTWLPLIISCLALASLIFIFNLDDTKIKAIQNDISLGKTKATSTLTI